MSNFNLKEIFNTDDWKNITKELEASFTQNFLYGEWQRAVGKVVKKFVILDHDNVAGFFQIIIYPLIGSKKYGYVPYGPVIKNVSADILQFLKEKINKISEEENLVFTRLDFWPVIEKKLAETVFKKVPIFASTGSTMQPRFDLSISLNESNDNLLNAMHEKAQYAIRTAEKRGVTVEIVTEHFSKYFEDFWSLMGVTTKRNEFSVNQKEYYEKLFKLAEGTQDIFLSVARLQNEILGIGLFIVSEKTSTYLLASSSDKHRNLQAPYLYLWKAILHAKEIGLLRFNFGGVGDPDFKMYPGLKNLTYFKQKFGGKLVKYSDFYDVVKKPLWYYLYLTRKRLKSLW